MNCDFLPDSLLMSGALTGSVLYSNPNSQTVFLPEKKKKDQDIGSNHDWREKA